MTVVRILDLETTGLDPLTDRIVEIAAIDFDCAARTSVARTTLINPGRDIPCTASAIHHITDEMVQGAPHFDEAIEAFNGADIYVAHNNRFDVDFLPHLKGKPWIDTYRCALFLWPDAPSHGNQALSYWRKTPRPPLGSGYPHRALYDAWTTFFLLTDMLDLTTIEQMIEASSRPAVLTKIVFGKHAGQKFTELPADYLQWIVKQNGMSEDVKHTATLELQRRRLV